MSDFIPEKQEKVGLTPTAKALNPKKEIGQPFHF